MGLLEGRTVLVTGVTMHTSIAFKAAQIAQDEGARVIAVSYTHLTLPTILLV